VHVHHVLHVVLREQMRVSIWGGEGLSRRVERGRGGAGRGRGGVEVEGQRRREGRGRLSEHLRVLILMRERLRLPSEGVCGGGPAERAAPQAPPQRPQQAGGAPGTV
jgi:N-methylhydantoinase B/oxoprolinase/acetone carboxylase alpha subunit